MVVAAKNGNAKKTKPEKKVPKAIVPPVPVPVRNITKADHGNGNTTDATILGSKIHAQRKFAQGASVSLGYSPVKHSKVGGKKRTDKRAVSPFLPAKRPKTEDFVAFLCYRGTQVLPPELDFFNYPPTAENVDKNADDEKSLFLPHSESKKNNKEVENVRGEDSSDKHNAASTSVAAKSASEPITSSNNSSSNRASTSSTSGHANVHTNSTKSKEKDKSGGGTPAKSSNIHSDSHGNSTSKSPALKRIPDVMVVVKQAEKAIAAFGKVRKDLTTALLKPTRINEQDARFAMTALKLKYQEKRMAKTKAAALSVASKLTKKGRNVILTRSKAKYQGDETSSKAKASMVRSKKSIAATRIRNEVRPQSRNAPSPDIIYGVSHAKNVAKKIAEKTNSSGFSASSSDSNSSRPSPSRNQNSRQNNDNDSSEDSSCNDSGSKSGSDSSSKSSSSSEESEDENPEPMIRSLRSGKELVMQPKKPVLKKPVRKKVPLLTRVSTRASHRKSTSPLRELPMYGVKKRKPKKVPKSKKKNLEKVNTSKRKEDKEKEKPKQKDEPSLGIHRPMRKTKETASIYLGLIGTFSSDEDDTIGKNEDDEESSGNSSSSETKFLEKQYNASMKREELSKAAHAGSSNNNKSKAKPKPVPTKTKSGLNSSNNTSSSKKDTKTPIKDTKNSKEQNQSTSKSKQQQPSKKVPMKRVLRSQSFEKIEKTSRSKTPEPRRITTRRVSASGTPIVPTSTSFDRRTEGAARKSASVYPRRRGSYYSSSHSSSSSDTYSESESETSAVEEKDKTPEAKTSKVSSINNKKDLKQIASKTTLAARKSASATPAKASVVVSSKEKEKNKEKKGQGSSRRALSEKSAPAKRTRSRSSSPSLCSDYESPASNNERASPVQELKNKNEKEKKPEEVKKVVIEIQHDTPSSVSSSSAESDDSGDDADTDDTGTSASSSENEPKRIIEKTSIAIQVDMDSEENVEMAEMYSTPPDPSDSPQCISMSMTPPSSISLALSNPSHSHSLTHTHNHNHVSHGHSHGHGPSDIPSFAISSIISHPAPQPPPPLSSFTSPFGPSAGPSFYPTLHLTPPVVSNIQFLARGTQEFSLGPPGITMNMNIPVPVTMPHMQGFGPQILQPNTMCFSSTSISAAATLQTIRSVAANLDIPLVRPIVGADNSLNIPFPRPPMPHMGSSHGSVGNGAGVTVSRPPLTLWSTSGPVSTDNRPHYHQNVHPHSSAFRVPVSVSGANTNVMRNPLLPLSIVHPQQQSPGHQQQQQQQLPRMSVASTNMNNSSTNSACVGIGMSRQNLGIPTTCSTSTSGLSQTTPGYSILHNLPNVSIVPRFDRNSKPVILPNDKEALERKLKKIKKDGLNSNSKTTDTIIGPSKGNKEKEKDGKNRKEKGGKKKKSFVIPQPTSPLTVRKDSTNPVTYVGTTKKGHSHKSSKHERSEDCKEKEKESTDPFNKLLQLKKIEPGTSSKSESSTGTGTPPHPVPSTPPPPLQNSDSKEIKKHDSEAGDETQKERNKEIKKEIEKVKEKEKGRENEEKDKEREQEKEKVKVRENENDKEKDKDKDKEKANEKEKEREKEKDKEREKVQPDRGDNNSDSQFPEAPSFYPNEEQFQDPLKYIEKIRTEAESFGIARIVPPRSFRPECNVDDDMRFTAYNHYIHKMFQRWGPNVHETMAIKEHLRKSDVDISSVPLIGGMEVDLCTLYHTVQSFGGLKETIEKQKWNKVSDAMHIPKAANANRASKLDAVYVKYVLPYEMLSESERKRLMTKVERHWNARQDRIRKKMEGSESESDSDEDPLEEVDDCVIKGKSTPLSSYYRVARNTRSMLFQDKEPTCSEVEEEYWKMVRKRTRHLCVYSGSIDCAGIGWGFPLPKAASKHPWNLKALANSSGSVLRSMGPVMGATVPTLHVGMVFTTYCWYRDPHCLPWIEYLHSGGNKIWYSVPAGMEDNFREALKKLMPLQCKNKKIWLASDSAMVPPELLREQGVTLYRAVQNPGEFLVVFPKAYTSAICTSYVVSESVCFAPPEWLSGAPQTFNDIRQSKEPPVFPIEKLFISTLEDHKTSLNILTRILPACEDILKEEFTLRKRLTQLGVHAEKLCQIGNPESKSKKNQKPEDDVQQCDNCNYILYLSLVSNEMHDFTYCLSHAVEYLTKHKSHVKTSILKFDRTQEDLSTVLREASDRLSEN